MCEKNIILSYIIEELQSKLKTCYAFHLELLLILFCKPNKYLD